MLSENNWIDSSWGGKQFRERTENLLVRYRSTGGKVRNFQEVCDEVADKIATKYNNINILFSGGSDSENVCNTFLRNNIPFTPVILHYAHVRGPLHEKWYAEMWCRRNKIEPKLLDMSKEVGDLRDSQTFAKLKPRLFMTGSYLAILDYARQNNVHIVTGNQLEYYPDADQMTYLEPQLKDYQGFVIEESDNYMEALEPDTHPWAFYYWNPDIMASFAAAWNTDLYMQENKAAIYGTPLRPKFGFPKGYYSDTVLEIRDIARKKFGTIDCALMGSKEQLISDLTG